MQLKRISPNQKGEHYRRHCRRQEGDRAFACTRTKVSIEIKMTEAFMLLKTIPVTNVTVNVARPSAKAWGVTIIIKVQTRLMQGSNPVNARLS